MSFQHLSPERKREISSMGGKAAHSKGRAHEFTKEQALEAGRLGGISVSQNREHMARIGRLGAIARHAKRPQAAPKNQEGEAKPGEGLLIERDNISLVDVE
jgi:general stress protein YciG